MGFLCVENRTLNHLDRPPGVTLYERASNCRDSHALPSIFKQNVFCSLDAAPQLHA
jgi:hypothetical protein